MLRIERRSKGERRVSSVCWQTRSLAGVGSATVICSFNCQLDTACNHLRVSVEDYLVQVSLWELVLIMLIMPTNMGGTISCVQGPKKKKKKQEGDELSLSWLGYRHFSLCS